MVKEVNYARLISAFGTFHIVLFFCGRLPPLRRSIADVLINGRPFFQLFIKFAILALRCIASAILRSASSFWMSFLDCENEIDSDASSWSLSYCAAIGGIFWCEREFKRFVQFWERDGTLQLFGYMTV